MDQLRTENTNHVKQLRQQEIIIQAAEERSAELQVSKTSKHINLIIFCLITIRFNHNQFVFLLLLLLLYDYSNQNHELTFYMNLFIDHDFHNILISVSTIQQKSNYLMTVAGN